MRSATVFVALAALACVSADGLGWSTADIYARPAYAAAYNVYDAVTGDSKSASETRDGDHTKGSYSVLQPDGRTRTVTYRVAPGTGFQADVSYSGWAAPAPVANQGWAAPAANRGWAAPAPQWGPGWGLPVPPVDTPDVAAAKVQHHAAHNTATANALSALAAARARAAVAPAVAVAAAPSWGSWGWGLPVAPVDTPDVAAAKVQHHAAHARATSDALAALAAARARYGHGWAR